MRGVVVNPNIVKTLFERNWIRVVGYREVPGRPELLGTTRDFLDYFGLKTLDQLPPLAELKSLEELDPQLALPEPIAALVASDATNHERRMRLKKPPTKTPPHEAASRRQPQRLSGCRRSSRSAGWPRGARPRSGFAPGASPSMAKPRRWAARAAGSDQLRLDGKLIHRGADQRARPPGCAIARPARTW